MVDLNIINAEDALALACNLDLSVETRSASLVALSALCGESSIPDIIDILRKAQDPQISLAAAQALSVIQSKHATKPLLRTMFSTSEDHIVFSCIYALWSLRDRRSMLAINRVVNNASLSPRTRGLAAEVLGVFRSSLPRLLALSRHPVSDVRCGALFGAAAITRDPRILWKYEALLRDHSIISTGQTVKELAARILYPSE